MIDPIYDPKATSVPVLRYLVAVAEHRHFGRAAAACYVTQPTLSAQVTKWERAMGVIVFERHAHGATVTPAGATVVRLARVALDALAALERATEGAVEPLAGPLRLGIIPTVGPTLLPILLPATAQAHPRLRLALREEMTDRLLAGLRDHRLDLAIMAVPVAMDGLVGQLLYDEDFLAAVPQHHPLGQQARLAPEDLVQALPLLLLDEGHCLRDQALAACRLLPQGSAGADTRATSLATLRQLVVAGVGCTLLPALEAAVPQAGIHVCPLTGSGNLRRIALLHRSSDPRAAAYAELAATLRAALPRDVLRPLDEAIRA